MNMTVGKLALISILPVSKSLWATVKCYVAMHPDFWWKPKIFWWGLSEFCFTCLKSYSTYRPEFQGKKKFLMQHSSKMWRIKCCLEFLTRSVIISNILVVPNLHFLGGDVKGVCPCVSVHVGVYECYSSSGHKAIWPVMHLILSDVNGRCECLCGQMFERRECLSRWTFPVNTFHCISIKNIYYCRKISSLIQNTFQTI